MSWVAAWETTMTIRWPPFRKARYELLVPHGNFSPRLREGRRITFDPKVAPKVGDVVALWHTEVPDSECTIGILARLSGATAVVDLDSSGNRVLATRLRSVLLDPAVSLV